MKRKKETEGTLTNLHILYHFYLSLSRLFVDLDSVSPSSFQQKEKTKKPVMSVQGNVVHSDKQNR